LSKRVGLRVHGDTYIYDKAFETFTGIKGSVEIGCRIHGYFKTTPGNHLSGSGCYTCGVDLRTSKRRHSIDVFVSKSKTRHGDRRYDYSLITEEYKNSATKVTIKCNECGHIFKQACSNHIAGTGCPKCNMSHGESIISKLLDDHNITYIPQYEFEDCRNQYRLPFDFYLPDTNTCIEFDGSLHYIPWNKGERSIRKFEMTQTNDKIKTGYCNDNNIRLIRIPYWDQDKIHIILESALSEDGSSPA